MLIEIIADAYRLRLPSQWPVRKWRTFTLDHRFFQRSCYRKGTRPRVPQCDSISTLIIRLVRHSSLPNDFRLTLCRRASLVGGENFTVQQSVPVCPLVNYAPKISYQLAVDPSGGKKNSLTCSYQFCELVSGVCGRVGSMRAGKWGSNTPQYFTKATQTTAIVQVIFRCPVAAVAYLGQLQMNPFQHG